MEPQTAMAQGDGEGGMEVSCCVLLQCVYTCLSLCADKIHVVGLCASLYTPCPWLVCKLCAMCGSLETELECQLYVLLRAEGNAMLIHGQLSLT